MQNRFSPFPVVGISGGVAHVFIGQELLYKTPNPAFLVDHMTGEILKHGPEETVREMCAGMHRAYAGYGLDQGELEVILFDAARVCPELLGSFYEKPFALTTWLAANRQLAA